MHVPVAWFANQMCGRCRHRIFPETPPCRRASHNQILCIDFKVTSPRNVDNRHDQPMTVFVACKDYLDRKAACMALRTGLLSLPQWRHVSSPCALAESRVLDILAAFPSAWSGSEAQAWIKRRLFARRCPESTRTATRFGLE